MCLSSWQKLLIYFWQVIRDEESLQTQDGRKILIRRYKSFLTLIRNKCRSTELYDKAVDELELREIECPFCKNIGQCKKHGRYTRYILEWVQGKKVCSSIEIIRVRCQHCKKTHSFLNNYQLLFHRSFMERFTKTLDIGGNVC